MKRYDYTIGSNDRFFSLKGASHNIDAILMVIGAIALLVIVLGG